MRLVNCLPEIMRRGISKGSRRFFQIVSPKQYVVAKTLQTEDSVSKTLLSPSFVSSQIAKDAEPTFSYSAQEFGPWHESARSELIRLLRLNSGRGIRSRSVVWRGEDSLGTYTKCLYEGSYGQIMPAYVCVPKEKRTESIMICLQGHTDGISVSLGVDHETESEWTESFGGRHFGRFCVELGITALCLEQESLGFRKERRLAKTSPHPCHDAAMQSLILGRTLLGRRIDDLLSVISHLRECSEDSIKVGVMGNSLGGTVALFGGACSDEVDVVIAGSCVSEFSESLMKVYHCSDLYVPDLMTAFRQGDILGLCAPRPLLVCQGVNDPIFPLKGLRKSVRLASEIYRTASAEKNLSLRLGLQGHRFYPEMAKSWILEKLA